MNKIRNIFASMALLAALAFGMSACGTNNAGEANDQSTNDAIEKPAATQTDDAADDAAANAEEAAPDEEKVDQALADLEDAQKEKASESSKSSNDSKDSSNASSQDSKVSDHKKGASKDSQSKKAQATQSKAAKASKKIPAYKGKDCITLNNNKPQFTKAEIKKAKKGSYERYSSLDYLGRCGKATACVGLDIMPTAERGSIGQVKPTGWVMGKYDFVDGKYLYNRCHLIGYQLTGENANEKNLITGTRYFNTELMLPFENTIANYVKATGNHVLYRVTPIYKGENLVAQGVKMEGYSVEDKGVSISFNVFCYNIQPGVQIDYSTGSNKADSNTSAREAQAAQDAGSSSVSKILMGMGYSAANYGPQPHKSHPSKSTSDSKLEVATSGDVPYVVNVNTGKFHKPDCGSVKQMKDSNKLETNQSRQELINQGYDPCKNCNP